MKRPRERLEIYEGTAPVSAPYLRAWRALTPGQRLVRAWRLRERLRDIQAVHDAKTFPKL